MKKLSYLALYLLVAIVSCSEESSQLNAVDFVNTSQISISIDQDSIIADGVSKAKITVTALHQSFYGKTVSLSISPVGKLENDDGIGDANKLSINLSETGKATAFIYSTETGTANIKASINESITALADIKFLTSPIQLIVAMDSVPADGSINQTIIVKARKEWSGKPVKFEISPYGTLIDPGNPGKTDTTIELKLSIDGERQIYFSSSSAGTSYVRVTIEGQTLSHVVKFYAVSPFVFQLTNDGLMADNYSVATLSVSTDRQLWQGKNVTFGTSQGTFSNGQQTFTANADIDGMAKAYLTSSQSGIARVTLSLPGNVTKEQIVTFTNAPPTYISVEPGTSTLPAALSSKTNVIANLERLNGMPSDNQIVVFHDSTEVNSSIGTFLNVSNSGTTKQASAQYWIQNNSYTGFVYIWACVTKADGKKICGKNRILIQ